jgi:hypothetical protein
VIAHLEQSNFGRANLDFSSQTVTFDGVRLTELAIRCRKAGLNEL